MTELKYTANYCEENIWQLCQHPELRDAVKQVLFVSSLSRNSPLQFQKSAQGGLPVWWDYHVILLASKGQHHQIYDFDTTLPFPCEAKQYLTSTFQDAEGMKPEDRPLFKIIDGLAYRESFHSDRKHMKDEEGHWIFEPPTWPLIQSTNAQLTLDSLFDFSDKSEQPINTLDELIIRLYG
ncbi:MAG: hypothetical protein RIF33_25515 [Cyclobacteriaceae bacterium]